MPRPLFQPKARVVPSHSGRRSLSYVGYGLAKGSPADNFAVQTKKMQPYGDNRRRLMLIGEGPGKTEASG